MFLENIPVYYPGILIAAVVYFVLGMIWYAPDIFGNQWKQELEKKDGSFSLPERHQSIFSRIFAYMGEFILSLIIAYILSLFLRIIRADEYMEGIIIAFWIWIGFIATTHFSAVLWGRKTLKNFFIHSSFILLGLIAMALVIIFFNPKV